MPVMEDPHRQVLDRLAAQDRLRALESTRGHDFTSNDYLGLAESPALKDAARAALDRGVPVGAGGSRLLRGNHPEHEALEAEAAEFFGGGAETRALYFPTGFAANALLAAALPREGDLILYDALMHASFRDGLDPARVPALMMPHNDVNAMEAAIANWRAGGGRGQVWIAAETLYSMDGDRAPLDDLVALAERHDAMLLLDEAHATGVYGEGGRGLAPVHDNIIALHTCGKALGAAGALVCLPRLYRDFIVNRGRAFIYSTAPSPLMAAIVRQSLRVVAAADAPRAALAALVRQAGEALCKSNIAPASGSQIQPIIMGGDKAALDLAAAMQARGYDMRAIRPPTVPEGGARLRIALTLNTDSNMLARMLADLAAEMAQA